MFGVGANELFIILLFGFLIFGPDKLPEMAKTLGRAIARFRTAQQEMSNVIKNEVYDPTADDPFKNPLDALSKVEQRVTREDRGESFTERKARYDKQRAAQKAAEQRRVTKEGAKSTDAEGAASAAAAGAAGAAKAASQAGADGEKRELKGMAESKAALDRARAAQAKAAKQGDADDADGRASGSQSAAARPTADELYGVKKRERKPGTVSVKRVPAAKKVAPLAASEAERRAGKATDANQDGKGE